MKENFTSGSVGGSWNRNAHGHRATGSGPVRHRASSLPDHPRDLAAYTYQAHIYCPACLIEAVIAAGTAAPAARDMTTDDVLEQCAGALAIDRHDDTTYDSSVFLDWLAPTRRRAPPGRCGNPL